MVMAARGWVPEDSEGRVQDIAQAVVQLQSDAIFQRLTTLVGQNEQIHEKECFNLNPATNVMNPKAERLLASGLGSRPSLGYPGDKFEMGLEAIEEIEVICTALCSEVFGADYSEIRVPSGSIANLYGFMATCRRGDVIIVPPPSIGGHVTHHTAGCAGLFGLNIIEAPVDADRFSYDLGALQALVRQHRPKLITIGGSLNLFEHPVAGVRAIADEVGAKVLYDAAHLCGLVAGGVWENPLDLGADVMTFSTYKSLGGPAGAAIVTRDAEMAEALDRIAFPGMTANFDVAKSAALAVTLLDWKDHGRAYAAEMVTAAQALARALDQLGVAVFQGSDGFTDAHQFALVMGGLGGGHKAAKLLRKSGFLTSAIGLPIAPVAGDKNGLRMGTPELVRWGMTAEHMPRLASLISRALGGQTVAEEVAAWRADFKELHFVH